MSWSELERLVETAESDPAMARALAHCRSAAELVLAARRLGFGVTRVDLSEARSLAQGQAPAPARPLTPEPARPLAGPQLFPSHRQRNRPTQAPAAVMAATAPLPAPGAGRAATVAQILAS
jgi:hypothetical protein